MNALEPKRWRRERGYHQSKTHSFNRVKIMRSFNQPTNFLAMFFMGMILGCESPRSPNNAESTTTAVEASNKQPQATQNNKEEEHAHQPGAHGGILVSLGRDSYHVEAIVESTGAVRLYTLGKEETRVIDVEKQSLKGFVKASGDKQFHSIDFLPEPQTGDAPEKTSQFVAILPESMRGQEIEVTIPNIVIASERFRLAFTTKTQDHNPSMPSKVSDSEERDLYLKPGGQYTTADIAANGNVTASQKFRGIKSAHDMSPKAGDRICPITETKANPKFAWTIGGREYLFCCPPCVDEFVRMAKNSQEALPAPETYTK